jgi:uncharacterized membrane protein YedE/YeeE
VRGKLLRPLRVFAIGAAAAITAAGLLALLQSRAPQAAAQEEEYALFYRFEVPPAIPGLSVVQEQQPVFPGVSAPEGKSKRTLNGTLQGAIGGMPISDASYSYASGASDRAGGGTFSMATRAGPVKNGRILMTSDGKQTTLLFLGIYLGRRLSFSLVGDNGLFGGTGVVMSGLAETDFQSHEQYVAAIRQAITMLPAADQQQIVAQADQNPRLVREYQQHPPTP